MHFSVDKESWREPVPASYHSGRGKNTKKKTQESNRKKTTEKDKGLPWETRREYEVVSINFSKHLSRLYLI